MSLEGDAPARRLAGAFGLAAVVLAVLVPLVGGLRRDGYSHSAQYISELGERGAPDGGWVSGLGFLPIAVCAAAFSLVLARLARANRLLAVGLLCMASVAVGYGVASVARCDPGCPESGSMAQSIHNVAGTVQYAGVALGLTGVAVGARRDPTLRRLARLSGVAAVAFALSLVLVLALGWTEPDAGMRGLGQRLLEVIAFGWIALVSGQLLRGDSGVEPRRLEG